MSIISFHIIRETLYNYQNLIIAIGLIISFSGGSWDITFHILSQPESFFSYPHTLVYTGIFIVISIFLINIRKNISNRNPHRNSNFIILSGAVLIIAAGPFDFSWHLKFGLDGLLSPPHITLLTGWMLVGLGNLRITNNLLGSAFLPNLGSNMNMSSNIEAANIKKYDNKDSENLDIKDQLDDLGKNGPTFLKFQLFLNLSFILVILSGFIYFFSLPFSETQFYNYNPNPVLAFFVYSLGFPILLSSFFIWILKNYPSFDEMILLIGSFYVIIMLFTQIISNPFLIGYAWFYILNIIPFGIIYLLNKKQKKKTLTKLNSLTSPTLLLPTPLLSSGHRKENPKKYLNSKIYVLYALILAISSFTICFPLNTYILNEELYGYLVYQNLVYKVYSQLFDDYFIVILSLSIVGGLLGLVVGTGKGIVKALKLKVI